MWPSQDILIGLNDKFTSLVAFNLKTRQSTSLTPDLPNPIEHWMLSPDGKYMYFSTAGAESKAMRQNCRPSCRDDRRSEGFSPRGERWEHSDQRRTGWLADLYARHRLPGDLRPEPSLAVIIRQPERGLLAGWTLDALQPYSNSFAIITRCTASCGVFPTAARCLLFRPFRGLCFS